MEALSSITNTEMESVYFQQCSIKSINGLSHVSRINNTLFIAECPFIKEINGLNSLVYICELCVESCQRLSKIEQLSSVSKIKKLTIRFNESLYDFTPLYNACSNGFDSYSVMGNGYNPTVEQILNGQGKP
jgi:hypothetical protein